MSLEDSLTIELPSTWLLLQDMSPIRDMIGSLVGYGSFPCNWNGGRPFTVDAQDIYVGPNEDDTLLNRVKDVDVIEEAGRDLVPQMARHLNDNGVPFYLTLTNIKPDEKIDEELFRFLEDLASRRDDNGVIVAHPMVYEKVRDNFGGRLKYIASVTRYNLHPSDVKGCDYDMLDDELLFKDFDHVVLKPENVMQSPISGQERKDKSIIIVNHSCQPDCPYQRGHYIDMIDGNHGRAQEYLKGCKRQRTLLVDRKRFQKLKEKGFSNFKIGRTMFYLHETLGLFPALEPVIPWRKSQVPKGEAQVEVYVGNTERTYR